MDGSDACRRNWLRFWPSHEFVQRLHEERTRVEPTDNELFCYICQNWVSIHFFKTSFHPFTWLRDDELKKINKFLASRPFLSCRYLGVSIEAVGLPRSNETELLWIGFTDINRLQHRNLFAELKKSRFWAYMGLMSSNLTIRVQFHVKCVRVLRKMNKMVHSCGIAPLKVQRLSKDEPSSLSWVCVVGERRNEG